MFAENLKFFRKRADLTQQELADKIGSSRSCIGMYERGLRRPDFETLEALADIFNVNMSTLLGEEKSAPTDTDEGEVSLIYRQLNDTNKAAALAALKALLDNQ